MQPICRGGQIGLCCSATSCPARRLTVPQSRLSVWHWLALAGTGWLWPTRLQVQAVGFQSGPVASMLTTCQPARWHSVPGQTLTSARDIATVLWEICTGCDGAQKMTSSGYLWTVFGQGEPGEGGKLNCHHFTLDGREQHVRSPCLDWLNGWLYDWFVLDSVDEYHAVPGRMRFALWQLLVFLERGLSGNKEPAPAGDQRRLGTLRAVATDRASLPRPSALRPGCPSNPVGSHTL